MSVEIAQPVGDQILFNAAITALDKVSTQISSSADLTEILETLNKELRKIDLECVIVLLEEDGQEGVLDFISIADGVIAKAEKILGESLVKFRIDQSEWLPEMTEVLIRGNPVFITNFFEFISRLFPKGIHILTKAVINLGNISSDTSAFYLPLRAKGRVFGSLSIWGKNLWREDLSVFMIFANQIANSYENTQLQKIEKDQAKELMRANVLVNALSRVSRKALTTMESEAIFKELGNELGQIGLGCSFASVSDDKKSAVIESVYIGNKNLRRIEKAANISLNGYAVPYRYFSKQTITAADEMCPIFLPSFSEAIAPLFSGIAGSVVQLGLSLAGISADTPGLFHPFELYEGKIGFLSVWGDTVRESDIPSYTFFCNQVCSSLENARLYDVERTQAEDLKRSRDLVNVLSNVVAEVNKTHETKTVLDTLGDELKTLGLHCLVALIDPDTNEGFVDFHSMDHDLIKTAEKYTKAKFSEQKVPLDQWPEVFLPVLMEGISKYFAVFNDVISEFLPMPKALASKALAMVGVTKDVSGIFLPLNREDRVIGCLAIWGENLREKDLQTYTVFSGQIASAFENARLYEAKQKQAEELEHDALHDSLTDLPNRDLFLNRLEHTIARQKRNPDNQFAILYLDLDQFKRVNDNFGHLVGDQVLMEIGRTLQDTIRDTDIVARLGGDEFAILLEDVDGKESVDNFCNRLMNSLSEPLRIKNLDYVNTVSIGVVSSSNSYNSPTDYLRDADIAMYKAKELGKQRFVVFDESMHDDVLRKLNMEYLMREGLKNQEFFLEYQPIICLKTNRVLGYEALVRWQSPERGLLSPMEFIPLAEETRVIHELGKWVLHEACNQYQSWIQVDPVIQSRSISVNVSTVQLLDPDFPEIVKFVLEESGLDAETLNLEITETALISKATIVENVIQEIHDLGVNIHLDDFGTGYSSLGFLANFPIDAIKIDRGFINDIEMDNNSVLVKAIIFMGHELGLQVIAEGVESSAQIDKLLGMKCIEAQGYFFAKPMCADRVTHEKY